MKRPSGMRHGNDRQSSSGSWREVPIRYYVPPPPPPHTIRKAFWSAPRYSKQIYRRLASLWEEATMFSGVRHSNDRQSSSGPWREMQSCYFRVDKARKPLPPHCQNKGQNTTKTPPVKASINRPHSRSSRACWSCPHVSYYHIFRIPALVSLTSD